MIQWVRNITLALGLVLGFCVSDGVVGVSSAPQATASIVLDARAGASVPEPTKLVQVVPIRWGPTSDERISFWRSDARVWVFERGLPTVAEMHTGPRYGDSDATIFVFDLEGNQLGWKLNFSRDRRGRITVREAGSNQHQELVVLANGSFYLPRFRHALLLLPDGSFEWAPGTLTRGEFVPNGRFSAPDDGRFRRMSDSEVVEFSRLIEMRAEEAQERRIRAQQQRAEADDDASGLFARGLAMVGVAAVGGDLDTIPLTGNPLEVLTSANDEIARQNAIGKAQLDATIAAAAQGQAPYATPVPSGANASGASGIQGTAAQARSSTTTQPLSFYFAVGLNPRQGQSRNPRCFSEVVTTSITYVADDPRSRGESIIAATDAYRASFIQECSRLGEVDSVNNVSYVNSITQSDAFNNRPHQARHPEDVYVRVQ